MMGCVTYWSLILCLMPALLLYFLGYQAEISWNKNTVETLCTVTGHKIYGSNCGRYPCYDGYIYSNYTDYNENYYQELVKVYNGEDTEKKVEEKLENNYPIGSETRYYYKEDDPTDVRIDYKTGTIYYVFFIILCVITGLIPLGCMLFIVKRNKC